MLTLQKPKSHSHSKRPSRGIIQPSFLEVCRKVLIQLCEEIIAKEGCFSYSINQKPEDTWDKKQVVIEEKEGGITMTISYKDYTVITLIHTCETSSLQRKIPRMMYARLQEVPLFIDFSFRIHRPA